MTAILLVSAKKKFLWEIRHIHEKTKTCCATDGINDLSSRYVVANQ